MYICKCIYRRSIGHRSICRRRRSVGRSVVGRRSVGRRSIGRSVDRSSVDRKSIGWLAGWLAGLAGRLQFYICSKTSNWLIRRIGFFVFFECAFLLCITLNCNQLIGLHWTALSCLESHCSALKCIDWEFGAMDGHRRGPPAAPVPVWQNKSTNADLGRCC
jgi:hypothetical protein